MQDLQYLEELNSPSNLRLLVLKLPYKYRERWRSFANDVLEYKDHRAEFHDLVQCIEKQATVVLDPLYGDIQDPVVLRKNLPSTTKDNRQSKLLKSSRSSFATMMSEVPAGSPNKVRQYNHDFSEKHYGGDKSELSEEDCKFLKIVTAYVTLENGNYCLPLPFRKEEVVMPNNRRMAEQRARYLQRKFRREEKFPKEYKDFMTDVLRKGYAEKVPQEQLLREEGKIWYIHHSVYHKRKKTIYHSCV